MANEKENPLDITDKPEGSEYIQFCGKTIRVHQYKNVAPPEPEASSWQEFLPSMEREQKLAEDFFEQKEKETGGSVSGKSPIPYDITEMKDGSTIITPFIKKVIP